MRLLAGLLLVMLASSVAACHALEPETSWQSVDLGEGSLQVRFLPVLVASFGRQTVRFYYQEGDGGRLLAETTLANDGAAPNDGNPEVERLGAGRWQVVLKGQEQTDELWVLAITDGSPAMERRSSGSKRSGGRAPLVQPAAGAGAFPFGQ